MLDVDSTMMPSVREAGTAILYIGNTSLVLLRNVCSVACMGNTQSLAPTDKMTRVLCIRGQLEMTNIDEGMIGHRGTGREVATVVIADILQKSDVL